MEEGIGIIAGSLPALRPLLSLTVGFGSSFRTPGAATSGRSDPLARDPMDRTNPHARRPSSAVDLNTFRTLAGEELEHDDGDSQRNIIKETEYTVVSRRVDVSEEERVKSQVLGWEQALKV